MAIAKGLTKLAQPTKLRILEQQNANNYTAQNGKFYKGVTTLIVASNGVELQIYLLLVEVEIAK